MNKNDLTNRQFGLLTAKYPVRMYHGKPTVWRCVCACGEEVDVRTCELVRGSRKSCGGREHHPIDLIDGTRPSLMMSKRSKRNTSGIKGVCYDKQTNSWCAYIGFRGKRLNLGRYPDLVSAALARKKAEEEIYHNFLVKCGIEIPEDKRDPYRP